MDYSKLIWYSSERQVYYEQVNISKEKQVGNTGEEIAKQWFKNNGYTVKESTSYDDSSNHTDLFVMINGEWKTVDVKYKKKFYIELVNNWSKPGWIFTGADYIFQIFQPGSSWDENYGYIYKREDMVNFINRNKPLFSDKYCKNFPDNSKLWEVYKTRLKDMNFLKKIKL